MSQPTTTRPDDGRTVDIFISYSARTDAERKLCSDLIDLLTAAFVLGSRAVFAYTVPGLGARGGARLLDELKEALSESRVVLAVVTPAAAESAYSQFEMAASGLGEKYTVPLLPDPSFHQHVPVLFREITARSLASLGDVCQLLEDLKEPLGRAAVEPACMWIARAEEVVASAHAVAGHPSTDSRIAALTRELDVSRRRSGLFRNAVLAAAAVALVAAIALAGLWARHAALRSGQTQLAAALDEATADLDEYRQAIQDVNRRSLLLPALKIEGIVTTADGRPAEHAIVAACAALPTVGASAQPAAPAEFCPEDLRLSLETDSDGVFRVDLRSLPLPEPGSSALGGLPPSPLEEIWLVARHADGGRVERVRTVLDKRITLR